MLYNKGNHAQLKRVQPQPSRLQGENGGKIYSTWNPGEIHYRGDDTDQLGTPQNAIGKKETFYYDKSTGNRIRLDLAIEYPNEVWSGSTFVDYEFFYFENLPESIQKKFDNSIEELMYYLDL